MIEQHGTRQLYRALNMTRQGIAVVPSHNLEGVEVSWLFLPESNRELRAKAVCIDTDLKFHLNIRSTSDHFLFCHLSDFIWRCLFCAAAMTDVDNILLQSTVALIQKYRSWLFLTDSYDG